jgi:hypothetical protein
MPLLSTYNGPSEYIAPVTAASYRTPSESINVSTTPMPTYQEFKAIQIQSNSGVINEIAATNPVNNIAQSNISVPVSQGNVIQGIKPAEANIKYVLFGIVGLVAILLVRKYFNK